MRKSRSSLFLMELIIVVLFFSLTSAVCLQVFVKAHSIDCETKNINSAVMWGDNLSEIFYEVGPDLNRILDISAPGSTVSSDGIAVLYLDKDYNLTDSADNSSCKITLGAYSDDDYNYFSYDFTDVSYNNTVFKFIYKSNIQEVSK